MIDDGITALHRITSLPIDKSDLFYSEYPAFKLGVRKSVSYYAKLLAPVAKQLIQTDPKFTDCVLTCPAWIGAPAGANLLCCELYALLRDELPESSRVTLIQDRHAKPPPANAELTQRREYVEYAKMSFDDRVKWYSSSQEKTIHEDARFRDRSVIFINDIIVTGTHQQMLRRYFENVRVAVIKWLYLIQVDNDIGRSDPELEWRINYSSFEDFMHLVSREEIQFTGKCIERLFQYELSQFVMVLEAIGSVRRANLLELVSVEGIPDYECFASKTELLKSYCDRDRA